MRPERRNDLADRNALKLDDVVVPEDLETFAAIQQRRPHHALPVYEATHAPPSCEIFPAPLDRVGFAGTEKR